MRISPVVTNSDRVSGVYAIVNVVNGRRYIGSSNHIAKRWRDHVWELTQRKHLNQLLQNAWNKHGADSFVCELVEAVEGEAALLAAEQRYIDANAGGYNLCRTAGKPPVTSRRGVPCSEETKQRLRAALKGRPLSLETRRRMSEARRKKPQTTRPDGWESWTLPQRISFAKTGKKASPEAIEKNRQKQLGVRPSLETRLKTSASLKATLAAKRLARERAVGVLEGSR